MKKFSLLLLSIIFSFSTLSARKTVLWPEYESRNIGMWEISKIEHKKKNTFVHLYCTFPPSWWIAFSKGIEIEDAATGNRYAPEAIQGWEFDKKLWMPKSGDTTMVMVYPRLPKSVKTINLIRDGDKGWAIYDVSLKKGNKERIKKENKLPPTIQQWFDASIAENDRSKSDKNVFFKEGKAKIKGHIKGYDKRFALPATAMIYPTNVLKNERESSLVQLSPDGRFEAEIEITYPQTLQMHLGAFYSPIYIEQGQTSLVSLDWQDFLDNDSNRDKKPKFDRTEFHGQLAKRNKVIVEALELSRSNHKEIQEKLKTISSLQYKEQTMAKLDSCKIEIESYCKKNNVSDTDRELMNRIAEIEKTYEIVNFISNKAREEKTAPENSLYDFLNTIPFEKDEIFISPSISSLQNRLEFSSLFRLAKYRSFIQEVNIEDQIKESAFPLSKKEKEIIKKINNLNKIRIEKHAKNEDISKEQAQLEELHKKIEPLKEDKLLFNKKMSARFEKNYTLHQIACLKELDSIGKSYGLAPSTFFDLTLLNTIKVPLKNIQSLENRKVLHEKMDSLLSTTLTKKLAEELFKKSLTKPAPKKIPDGKGGELFKKILAEHKGKFVLVDFWGTFCGPCLFGIREMRNFRDKHKNSEDVAFVFLTSENESPKKQYNKIVSENRLEEHSTHWLDTDDYNYIKALFRINGIPHYMLIDREGNILDEKMNCDVVRKIEGLITETRK